ncbi:MAG TPA: bifunctional precorrin-2 dehydrogenase/sirohydrochlorin ferrochelatase [Methanospirillum sp.]|nr:bifunctional precorrin-2 dehydrogenase/sirohydrochlorin ferrochelatase [Methanospirillum sp.]
MIDCIGKKVVIFGGGEVSARKSRYFSDEAEVTVYSRTFCDAFGDLQVRQVIRTLSAGDQDLTDLIAGAFLVITTTQDQILNNEIIAHCRHAGVLCNNASGQAGDVTLPAKISGERYTIAVSTAGASPAVARYIREDLQERLAYLDQMISLQESLRCRLKSEGVAEEKRRAILTASLRDQEIWDTLPKGQDAALELIEERYSP